MSQKELPSIREDWAMFLDVDGTLLDFAETPDQVVVPPDLLNILGRLHGYLGGAVALVSGRKIADLDRLFSPLFLPAAGQHGAELRETANNVIVRASPPASLAAVSAALRHFAASRPGLLVEDKNSSVAVHYRREPRYRHELEEFTQAAVAANSRELEMLEAVMAIDVKPRAVDKGRAVAWFMDRAAFGGRVPVFIGDDRTDEDGFAAVTERAGYAIQVGTSRPRVAPWHIAGPADLRQWLQAGVADLTRT